MAINENKKQEFLNRLDGLIAEAKKLLNPMNFSPLRGSANDEKQRIVTSAMMIAERIIKPKAPDYFKDTIKTVGSAKTADRALEIATGMLEYLQVEASSGHLDCEFIEYSADETKKLLREML